VSKVKKGDSVVVIAGKDKGKKGKVLAVLTETDRVLVEGINRVVRHTKVGTTNRGGTSGGILHQESPIHISNVKLAKDEDKKPAAKKATKKATKKAAKPAEVETEAIEATPAAKKAPAKKATAAKKTAAPAKKAAAAKKTKEA